MLNSPRNIALLLHGVVYLDQDRVNLGVAAAELPNTMAIPREGDDERLKRVEAELYAGLRRMSETLGFVHLMREFKSNDWGRIVHRVDASACRAIMLRRGFGGLTHITVKSLWVQEAVREYSIAIERVPRDVMHAHIFASPSSAEELKKHLTELNPHRDGEAEV